jgi:hypothetical protein
MSSSSNAVTPPAPAIVRSLLWIDCSGALVVGVLMFGLSE